MFCRCEALSQTVAIPDSVVKRHAMFARCKKARPISAKVANRHKTYSLDHSSGTLTVYSCTGVHDFCIDNGINPDKFDYPVIIADSVTDCSFMFIGCASYNQPVVIPNSVINCECMFLGCTSYNQSTVIPDSVINCISMFEVCTSYDQPIIIPNSVTDCERMFCDCVALDQNIVIPDSVIRRVSMFGNCKKMQHYLAEEKLAYSLVKITRGDFSSLLFRLT